MFAHTAALWAGIAVVAATVWLISRRYQPNMVLLLAGLALNLLALFSGSPDVLPAGVRATGFAGFDLFALLGALARAQLGEVGFVILVSGGFVAYMQAIGASDRFVSACSAPLLRFGNPYLVLAGTFVMGNLLGFAIPSATGLAMLMIVTAYPLLVRLGCSPMSVAAVIASAMAVSYAPSSGVAVKAAELAGLDPLAYLFTCQIPVAVPIIASMAVAHYFAQQYFDEEQERDAPMPFHADCGWDEIASEARAGEGAGAPALYALLPLVPAALLLAFNRLAFKTVTLTVSEAMLAAWVASFLVDLLARRNPRLSFTLSFAMFRGMGAMLTSTVGLVFVAVFFAQGLRAIGLVEAIVKEATHIGFSQGSSIVLTCVVGMVTVLTGSGTAAFSSLARVAAKMTGVMGVDDVSTILMMNITVELLRAVSPVAAVVIVVASYAGVDPFAIVRRTIIPCTVGFVVMLTCIALSL